MAAGFWNLMSLGNWNHPPSQKMNVGELPYAKIHPLIKALAAEKEARFRSCLDIGSGLRIQDSWFQRFPYASEPRRFVAAEVDPGILAQLHEQGVETLNPLEPDQHETFDLSMALETIEHLRPDETVGFLNFCARVTEKLFVLTTPNFEYWRNLKATDDYRECRWHPDHFRYFKPNSNDPHDHKQEMTPRILETYIGQSAFSSGWDVRIFRAWPWQLVDEAREVSFRMHFKLFLSAYRI